MEGYINLDKELEKLGKKFQEDLIRKLNERGHSKTGNLERSITLKFDKTNTGYEINLEALEYIKYLDGGDLLDKFLEDKTKELKEEIAKAIKKDIIKQLTQDNN